MDQQLRDAYLLLLQHHLLNQQLKLKESGGGERDQDGPLDLSLSPNSKLRKNLPPSSGGNGSNSLHHLNNQQMDLASHLFSRNGRAENRHHPSEVSGKSSPQHPFHLHHLFNHTTPGETAGANHPFAATATSVGIHPHPFLHPHHLQSLSTMAAAMSAMNPNFLSPSSSLNPHSRRLLSNSLASPSSSEFSSLNSSSSSNYDSPLSISTESPLHAFEGLHQQYLQNHFRGSNRFAFGESSSLRNIKSPVLERLKGRDGSPDRRKGKDLSGIPSALLHRRPSSSASSTSSPAVNSSSSVGGLSPSTTTQQSHPNQPQHPPLLVVKKRERTMLPCSYCGKAFDRPSLLKRHVRTHTGEKPHVCDVCGKGFSTSSSLNTHRRIHSGEKPHQCPVCGKRFTASSNLYYHRMTHNKEKPHKCKLCPKSFPTPGDLKSHMYVHNGSWPFKCDRCNRGFSKATNLKHHYSHCSQRQTTSTSRATTSLPSILENVQTPSPSKSTTPTPPPESPGEENP